MPGMLEFEFDEAPYRLSGTVIAALLNHEGHWSELGEAAHAAPYKGPAQRPVLGVRPPGCVSSSGGTWPVPASEPGVLTGAGLGIVIGRPACRLSESRALDVVAAYLLVNDGTLSVSSHYRPGLRQRVRDGFCVLGDRLVPAHAVPDPDNLDLQVLINGHLAQRSDTRRRVRHVRRLIADVSAFMTLSPGDLLLLGPIPQPPLARVGQTVSVRLAGFGELQTRVVAEDAA